MSITPPETRDSTRSPFLMSAWRRTLGGTTKPALSLATMIMITAYRSPVSLPFNLTLSVIADVRRPL